MASTNADQFARAISNIGRQIPFAVSLALNRTGDAIQRDQVERFHEIFTIRTPSFFGRPESAHRSAVKRTKKASKRDPVVELAILPPGGLQRADIIGRHESARQRRPSSGGSLAVPVEARRGKLGKIPKKFRPKSLDFQPHGSSGRVFRGKERTFLIRNERGGGTIYQRVGRRRSRRARRRSHAQAPGWNEGTRVLFRLSQSTPLDPELGFFVTASRRFQRSFPAEFHRAFAEALSTARGLNLVTGQR